MESKVKFDLTNLPRNTFAIGDVRTGEAQPTDLCQGVVADTVLCIFRVRVVLFCKVYRCT